MLRYIRAYAAAGLALFGASSVQAQSSPTASPTPSEARRSLTVNGDQRSYLLYVPSGYRRGQPAPLVLVFHGGSGSASGIAPHTGFSRLAEREGFLVVYPDAIGGHWNDGRGFTAGRDDVAFVRALLDTLGGVLSIDPRRIYATGISNGAMFSYRLACDLPGVFAAVAPVAGAMPIELADLCAHPAPVSVLALQGTRDPLMPYNGGGVARRHGQVLSADRSIRFWAGVSGCTAAPASTLEPDRSPGDGTRVRRTVYAGCRDGRAVELYSIEGGGHTWPGGPDAARIVGRVSRDLDGTSLIWSFFSLHPNPSHPERSEGAIPGRMPPSLRSG